MTSWGGLVMTEGGKTHRLVAKAETATTGFFDGSIPPVLTIESGDTVVLNTLMLMENRLRCGMTSEELGALVKSRTPGVGPHTLTGPSRNDPEGHFQIVRPKALNRQAPEYINYVPSMPDAWWARLQGKQLVFHRKPDSSR